MKPGAAPSRRADLLGELASLERLRSLDLDAKEQLSQSVASALLTASVPLTADHREVVRRLSRLAVDTNPALHDLGQDLIFARVAESLGDSFAEDKVRLHDAIFAEVIEFCRRLPAALPFHTLLERFGLRAPLDLLDRKAGLATRPALPSGDRSTIRKVFVLSRVTLGADVAVTSIVLQKVARTFPRAERFLLGPPALEDLFAGCAGLQLIPQPYDRRGGILGRLDSWRGLVATLGRAIGDARGDACLVVDPDSRFTQLGLLPVAGAEVPYCFFQSRSYERPGLETLGELTVKWAEETFGADEGPPLHPIVALRPSSLRMGEALLRRLRGDGAQHVVTVNLGVGGNPRKRMPGRFELELLQRLLHEGSVVVVDKGVGEEVARVEQVVAALRGHGWSVEEIQGPDLTPPRPTPSRPRLLTYQGGVGPFAALLRSSDLYIGYDSAFQHIAAAQAVPLIDVFVDAPSPAFLRRWRPHSRAPVCTIQASSGSSSVQEILDQTIDGYRRIRRSGTTSQLDRAKGGSA